MTYENQVPEPAVEHFTPRVFGFKIHQSSASLPRLRNLPGTAAVCFCHACSLSHSCRVLAYLTDFRAINQRTTTFPPHSLVKILSPNDEEDEMTRLAKKRSYDGSSKRVLLSNNIIEKDVEGDQLKEISEYSVAMFDAAIKKAKHSD